MSDRAAAGSVANPCGRKRSEEVRQRILTAAHELLHEKGFRALTIEGIAERAGAGKVTLYRWWSSKAAIVLEALLENVGAQVAFKETASPLDDLRDYLEEFSALISGRSGVLLASLLAEGVLDPEVGQVFRDTWLRPRRAEAAKLMQRAQDAGELTTQVDIDAIMDMFFGPIYYRLVVQHAPITREFAHTVWATVSRGLVPKRAPQLLAAP